jgi:2'-5' RNA ligase
LANWFVGVRVPAGDWFTGLPEIPKGFQRFAPADLHITLAFLGDVGPMAARQAWDARQAHGPIEAELGAVRPFGGKGPIYSALSAEVDTPAVKALLSSQRNVLRAAAGLAPEQRTVWPHATLTRPVHNATEAQLRSGLAWAREVQVAGTPVVLKRLALFTHAGPHLPGLFRVVYEAAL